MNGKLSIQDTIEWVLKRVFLFSFPPLVSLLAISPSTLFYFYVQRMDYLILKETHFWFFSTITQTNGALLGLLLVSVGLSYSISGKNIFTVFSQFGFALVHILLLLLFLTTSFSVFLLSTPPLSVGALGVTIECITIVLFLETLILVGVMVLILEINGSLQWLSRAIKIKDLSFDFGYVPHTKHVLKLIKEGEPIQNLKGEIRTNKGLSFPIDKEGLGGKFGSDCNIPIKELIEKVEPREEIEFNVSLTFRSVDGTDEKVRYYFTAQKLSDDQKLQFIKRP